MVLSCGLTLMLGFPKPSILYRRFVHPLGYLPIYLQLAGVQRLQQGFRAASFVQKGVVQSCAIVKAIPWIDRRGVDT